MPRSLLTILIASVTILWGFSCKKIDSEKITPERYMEGDGVLTTINAEVNAANQLMLYGATHPDVTIREAMMKTAEIMRKQRGVKRVVVFDSLLMRITVDNGLSGSLRIDEVNDENQSISRGGQPLGQIQQFLASGTKRSPKNKNVLFFSPVESDLYSGTNDRNNMRAMLESIQQSPAAVTLKIENERDSSFHLIETFRNYGLVMMATHGAPYGFRYGIFRYLFLSVGVDTVDFVYNGQKERVPKTNIRIPIGNEQALREAFITNNSIEEYNMLMSGDLESEISFRINTTRFKAWYNKVNQLHDNEEYLEAIVTTRFLEKMPNMDSTILFANMCYSGASLKNGRDEDGRLYMRDLMTQKGLAAYYGWVPFNGSAKKVANEDAIAAEISFANHMFNAMDTTGAAYKNNGEAFKARVHDNAPGYESFMQLYGAPNYWYRCGEGSFTDPRDGEKYRLVCINGKEWFAENLRFNSVGSVFPNENPTNINPYGRLYSWSMMMNGQVSSNSNPSKVKGICPEGWHIPSLAEYQEMASYLGGLKTAGRVLKTVNGWNPGSSVGIDSVKFSVLPAGQYELGYGYGLFGTWAQLWTSYSPAANNSSIYTIQFSNSSPEMFVGQTLNPGQSGNPPFKSCRCARD